MITAADLRFDPVTHTSTRPDGSGVPHVTTVLSAVGVSTNFEEIGTISARSKDNIEERRALGTCVHMDCHAFDDGELVWESVDARVLPFVEAWDICRQNFDLVPVARERRIYHPIGFTGTLDGIFIQQSSGKRILGDLKIGDPADAAAEYQTAAYEAGWMVDHPDEPIDERWAIRLCPELRIPYRITNYTPRPTAWQDFPKFQAFLTTYYEQAVRRRRS